MRAFTERAAASIIFAGTLAVAMASSGMAEPGDVTVASTADGSTVTTTITNGTGEDIVCGVVGMDAADDVTNPESVAVFREPNVTVNPGSRELTFSDVPDGDYLVHWICRDPDGPEGGVWGSSPLPETAYAMPGTAQPIPLSVNAA
ncbi:hypothetical protein BFN03_07865 [Rhodococcus sp. WMMA185]|uniref:hypothetical protein n=1 Tax=Rhodococcus sp. WMMA185 TaxID=679318 RepID=UPI00087852C0|nr:hypothetical protein [Rhodococcus sp. WMMA185]AOW92634.1 hypothetical protein BFN03_07865 [Rhodococcus sp. WMMA185]